MGHGGVGWAFWGGYSIAFLAGILVTDWGCRRSQRITVYGIQMQGYTRYDSISLIHFLKLQLVQPYKGGFCVL